MLVLSRRCGQEVIVGDNIRVKVLEVRGNAVKLGFAAPRNVNVRRSELIATSRFDEGEACDQQRRALEPAAS